MTTHAEPDAAAVNSSPTPFAVEDPTSISTKRYHSPEFAAWEDEKLWKHCWQMACREDQIPEPGDFIEYEIRGRSILIVRQNDYTVKGFFNACLHRATALGEGSGEFMGGQIVCPYHGWRWNIDGTNTEVFAEAGFEKRCLETEKLRLREVRTASALGMIFINTDPDGPSFADTVGHAVPIFERIGWDRMKVRWWRYAILPANWKIAQEAFMESYHLPQAHPSLNMGATEYNDATTYEVLPGGNAHMTAPTLPLPDGMTPAEYFRRYNQAMHHDFVAYPTDREMFIQAGLQNKKIPDENYVEAFFSDLYTYAESAGIPLPPIESGLFAFGHIFPNLTLLSQYGSAIMYRSRPLGDGTDRCMYEVWALQIPAAGDDCDPPELEGPMAMEDWPRILQEDFANVIGQQKGVRSEALDGLIFSETLEPMITNHHQELDRYLRSY